MARHRQRDRIVSTACERQLKLSLDVSPQLPVQVARPIRSANFWNLFRRTAEMVTKAVEYKVTPGLFDPTPPIPRESDS